MKKIVLISLISLVPKIILAQCESNYCTWDKVFIKGGTLNCGEYEDQLNEQFNSNTLDTNLWQTFYWSKTHPAARIGTAEHEMIYFDENVVMDGTHCNLIGKYLPGSTWTDEDPNTHHTWTRDITCGMIMGKENSQSYRFGKYEASIKISGNGWWPSFYLWHHDEVDVMENFNAGQSYSYNMYSGPDCKVSNEYNSGVNLSSTFHTYGVEWTPFKLIYYFDDIQLPKIQYKFYKLNGEPLDINCGDNIPEGFYFINPTFPQSRERGFKPIIALGVLPKYGLNPNCTKGDCTAPYCFLCTDKNGNTKNCNYGYPIEPPNCKIIGEVPTTMSIDWVKISSKTFNVCNSVLIYGENCYQNYVNNSLVVETPLLCKNTCLGEVASIFLEDIVGHNWESEVVVDTNNITSSADISIGNKSNYQISYQRTSYGLGEIYIPFTDDCGHNSSVTYKLSNPEDDIIEYKVLKVDPCNGLLQLKITKNSECHNFRLGIENGYSLNLWNGTHPIDYSINENDVTINFQAPDFTRHVIFDLDILNSCNETISKHIDIDIPKCADCCPAGAEFDGVNCTYLESIPIGYTGYVYNNDFWTIPNCNISTNNSCCPSGYVPTNGRCKRNISVSPGFQAWLSPDNGFYTTSNCNTCCPSGFTFDGVNCHLEKYFYGVNGYVSAHKFYTTTNCHIYSGCCPPGSTYDPSIDRCFFGSFPSDYTGFVYNNSFYTFPMDCRDGLNSPLEIRSSVLENSDKESSVELFPNPFEDNLSIELKNQDAEKIDIFIYSINGQLEYHKINKQNRIGEIITINPDLKAGLYITKILIDSKPHIFKIIKI